MSAEYRFADRKPESSNARVNSSHARVNSSHARVNSSHSRVIAQYRYAEKPESSHARIMSAEYRFADKPESSHAHLSSAEYRSADRPEIAHARVRIAEIEDKFAPEKEELKRQSLSLIEETNRTFKELTSTLNKEQDKLAELEAKRQSLLEEMMELKVEIEKEKEACCNDLEESGQNDTESIDSWFGLNDEEIERKQRASTPARESRVTRDYADDETNNARRRSSVEVANDILDQLETIHRRASIPLV